MSLWIGNKEVGLSPGQTGGDVGGEYIERPESVPTSQAYIPGKTVTEVKVTRDDLGRPLSFHLYKYDQYGNLMSVGTQKAGTGNPIIYTPPSQVTREQAERYNVFQEREYNEGRALAAERVRSGLQKAPSPFQIGEVSYGGLLDQNRAERRQLLSQGYKPIFTEGNQTIYAKKPITEVTISKYGKMVKRDELTEPFLGVFTPDKFIGQIDKSMRDISTKIDTLNKEISEKYGLTETVEEATKFYRHAEFLQEYDPKYKDMPKKSELGKAMTEYAIGFTEEAANKPVTAAGNALFALLVTKGVGGLASKASILTQGIGAGKIASKVNAVNILGTSLATMYGIDVTQRAIAAENKAKFAGQITATEILPFAAGGYVGTKKLPSIPVKDITGKYINDINTAVQALTPKISSLRSHGFKGGTISMVEVKGTTPKAASIPHMGYNEPGKKVRSVTQIVEEKELKLKMEQESTWRRVIDTDDVKYFDDIMSEKARNKARLKHRNKIMSQNEALANILGVDLQQVLSPFPRMRKKYLIIEQDFAGETGYEMLKGEELAHIRNTETAPGLYGGGYHLTEGDLIKGMYKEDYMISLIKKATKRNPVYASVNIQKARTILGAETKPISITKQASFTESRTPQSYKTVQAINVIPSVSTVSIIESILKTETKQHEIQKAKEILKPRPEKKQRPEPPIRKLPPPPPPTKNFIAAVDKIARLKKKAKWVWDVNNPVPTLEEIL